MSEPKNRPNALSGRVILLVEDEASLLSSLGAFLRLKGIEVLEAESGEQAIALLRQGRRVDLVLSDVEMPGGVSGVDLVKWIKVNRPSLPVVLTSGRQRTELPNVPFLAKPYRLSQLLPIIERTSSGRSEGTLVG
jgi:DNA-binding NtrC family response regulator